MAYSYQTFVGSSNSYPITQIDGYLQVSHLKVYKNEVLQAAGYTFTSVSGVLTLSFDSAPAATDVITVRRETPKTQATRVVDFSDGSVLTANDLDRSALQLLYIAQEAQDTGNGGLPYDETLGAYNATSYRISNLADPINQQDAVTRSYVESLQLFGTATGDPQFWQFDVAAGDWTGSAGAWTASKELTGLYGNNQNMMIVTFGGVIQTPGTAYQVLNGRLYLYSTSTTSPTGPVKLVVRNFGISRAIGATTWNSITDKPAFGTASLANLGGTSSVPANATSTEAVRGNDPRLTDARTPTAHYNSYTTVTSTGAAGGETLATALANRVDKNGGTFTAVPTCSFPPTTASHLANKAYVDNAVAPLEVVNLGLLTSHYILDVANLTVGKTYVYIGQLDDGGYANGYGKEFRLQSSVNAYAKASGVAGSSVGLEGGAFPIREAAIFSSTAGVYSLLGENYTYPAGGSYGPTDQGIFNPSSGYATVARGRNGGSHAVKSSFIVTVNRYT